MFCFAFLREIKVDQVKIKINNIIITTQYINTENANDQMHNVNVVGINTINIPILLHRRQHSCHVVLYFYLPFYTLHKNKDASNTTSEAEQVTLTQQSTVMKLPL